VRTVLVWLIGLILFAALAVVLKLLGISPMTMVAVIFTVAVITLVVMAVRRFRSGRTTGGAVCIVLAAILLLLDLKTLQFRTMMSSPMQMPPTTVSSATVKQEDWAPTLSAVGSVSAVQGAMVSAELAGIVAEVRFPNGGLAKKNDVLVRLDASAEEAQLHTAEADLELARSDLQRARDLATRHVISNSELDSAESKFGQKEGVVNQMRSMISKKEVRAPFEGQLGIRQVNVGQMVNPGQQVVSLQALDPVYVDFALPQQQLARLSAGLDVKVTSDALPGREFNGKLTAINSAVDPVTRNVPLQVTLDNHDGALRPGMFAKVEVILPEKNKTLVIPGSAVSYAPYGDSLYVIEKKKDEKTKKETQVLRQAFVRVGEARGDFVAVTQGVKAGDVVVSTGVFKLRNGMPVVINNELAPKPQLNPKPPDT
jgi:membrane fusion protein (multidrug efflux system)